MWTVEGDVRSGDSFSLQRALQAAGKTEVFTLRAMEAIRRLSGGIRCHSGSTWTPRAVELRLGCRGEGKRPFKRLLQ